MPSPLQLLIQLSLCCILQNEVHPGGIIKVAIESENVGVSKVGLDFNLTTKLVFNVGLLQLVFEQDLQGGIFVELYLVRMSTYSRGLWCIVLRTAGQDASVGSRSMVQATDD